MEDPQILITKGKLGVKVDVKNCDLYETSLLLSIALNKVQQDIMSSSQIIMPNNPGSELIN